MQSHKSLIAWKEAKAVTIGVLRMSRTSWKPQFAAIFGQLQRSSVSVQLNIAEGYGFGPSPRMRNHLRIAYASAVETADLLELLAESDLFEAEKANALLARCMRTQKLLTGLLRRYGWVNYSRPSQDANP
jgi:four helix bundle protein